MFSRCAETASGDFSSGTLQAEGFFFSFCFDGALQAEGFFFSFWFCFEFIAWCTSFSGCFVGPIRSLAVTDRRQAGALASTAAKVNCM